MQINVMTSGLTTNDKRNNSIRWKMKIIVVVVVGGGGGWAEICIMRSQHICCGCVCVCVCGAGKAYERVRCVRTFLA